MPNPIVNMPESINDQILTLIDSLKHPHVEERWNAANKLVEYGEEVIVPLFDLFPKVDWSIQHIIIWVVGEVRTDSALEFLVQALSSPTLHIQLSAARALEKLKTADSAAALERWSQQSRI